MDKLQHEIVTEYMKRLKEIAKNKTDFNIVSQHTDSEISYYNWDLSFKEDINAVKEDNLGNDEVQIIFNLNQDIEWSVYFNSTNNKQIVSMNKGEVCIYRNDNNATSMQYKGGINFKFKSLQMPTQRFKDLIDRYFSPEDANKIGDMLSKSVRKTIISPEMLKILQEIDSADRYKEFKGVFLEGKMIELTALVLYGVIYENEAGQKRICSDNEDFEKIENLRERIQLSPGDTYNSEELAIELSMSVSKLNRLFRNMYGTSIHAYIQEQRLEYAALLMSEEGCTVTDAAMKAGYNNLSYFTRSFVKRYGVTPKKWRG
ncbi:MAG: AraC family transcriptional regulator [Eubacterium sp.]|nr:AraC family transcriptional regulator [Eubacterium sp.]